MPFEKDGLQTLRFCRLWFACTSAQSEQGATLPNPLKGTVKSSSATRNLAKLSGCQKPSVANPKVLFENLPYYVVFVIMLALAVALFLSAQWQRFGLDAQTTGVLILATVVVVFLSFFLGLASIIFKFDFQRRECDDHPSQANQ